MGKFSNFHIKKIAKNENGHANAFSILASVQQANHARVFSLTILEKASLEEAKKVVQSVDASTNP